MDARNITLVAIAGLSDHKLHSKLAPLLATEAIDKIFLIRRRPLQVPKVHNCSLPSWLAWFFPLAELYRILCLLWLCAFRRPTMLIGIYMVPHGIYAAVMSAIFNIPTIQLIIGTDLEKMKRWPLLSRLLKRAQLVGARGPATGQELIALGVRPEQIFYPPNVLDTALYEPDPSASPEYDLVFVGALKEVKQPQLLVEAISRLRRDYRPLRLAVIGDGPLREALEISVEQLGLKELVEFTGNLSPLQVVNYLQHSRLFVMCSRSEGLPMAMVEALSCELPVIVPDIGDITELAHHGQNAWVYSPVTAGELACSIAQVLDNSRLYDELRAGAAETRKQLQAGHSLASSVSTWEQALFVLLQKERG